MRHQHLLCKSNKNVQGVWFLFSKVDSHVLPAAVCTCKCLKSAILCLGILTPEGIFFSFKRQRPPIFFKLCVTITKHRVPFSQNPVLLLHFGPYILKIWYVLGYIKESTQGFFIIVCFDILLNFTLVLICRFFSTNILLLFRIRMRFKIL